MNEPKYLYWHFIVLLKKCSDELSTKALLGRKYALVDSTSRIQIVLEWVFLQVILHNMCFYIVSKHVNEMACTRAYWRVLARTCAYWHLLAHTGKGTKRTKGTIGKNEDFRTFSKRVRRKRKKSNEEAHWLRQERLIFP